MTSFPKTTYWRPLVTNSESVDKTTNPSFKNPHAPSVAENEAEFVLAKYFFEYISVSLFPQQVTEI